MKGALVTLALAASVASWPFFRASNSARWTDEGRQAFAQERYADAVAAFTAAASARLDPTAEFNRGTATIAAGDAEAGEAILREIPLEADAATDAIFNRGNAALGTQAFDEAIAHYEEVLRREPSSADAKRNLEIALRRQQNQQEQQRDEEQGDSGPERPQPQDGEPEEDEGDQPRPSSGEERREMSPEEILRAIAQQEREEMRRMRRERAGERRAVGW